MPASPLRYDPTNHINTFRLVHSAGREIDVIVLDRTAIEAPEPIATLFGCAAGTLLYHMRGVAVIDGRRTSYEENYLLAEAIPGFLDLEYQEPITNFLIEHVNLRTSQTAVSACSVGLHGPVADALRVTAGAPGWYVTRIKTSNGRIVQVDRDFWIANALEFTIGNFSG